MTKLIGYSEPWHCSACGIFVYNLKYEDGNWYPCPGAPTSRFLSATYTKVCNICWEAHLVLATSDYWVKLESEQRGQNKQQFEKHRPGGNYLG